MDDLPAFMPAARGERLLECVIQDVIDETLYQVRVRRVTLQADGALVGGEVLLSVLPETLILWIGDATMDVGTIVLIPVDSVGPVDIDVPLRPLEVTLQNGTGTMF
jgi:hypothetical protein